MRTATLLILLSTSPLAAETIPGTDDPAFRAPFERALQGDDPTARDEIRAAAEAGNLAALRAMPTVMNWFPPAGTLPERSQYRMINGQPLDPAVAAASPVAADWIGARAADYANYFDRFTRLYAAGEAGKAADLYIAWVNHTSPAGPLPPGLADLPLPAYVFSLQISERLIFSDDPTDDALIVRLLRDDRLEGWMALANLAGIGSSDGPRLSKAPRIAAILATAGIDQTSAMTRMQETRVIVGLLEPIPTNRNPSDTTAAAALMRGRAEFLPIETFCRAQCADTAPACEAAWLQAFGYPFGANENAVPETALVPPEVFYATPRGADALMPTTLDRFREPDRFSAVIAHIGATDACLAQQVTDVMAARHAGGG